MMRATSPLRRAPAIGDTTVLTVSMALLRSMNHFTDVSARTSTLIWRDPQGRESVRLKVLSSGARPQGTYLHIQDVLDRRSRPQRIDVVSTTGLNGSRRWWFVCPVSGRRVAALHRPLGARLLASRHAHGLRYVTQRYSARLRALRVREQVRSRLGCGLVADPRTRPKPKGMHWHTHRKLVEKALDADRVLQGYAERWYARQR